MQRVDPVEVMQVVKPELRNAWLVPIHLVLKGARFVQEIELAAPLERAFAPRIDADRENACAKALPGLRRQVQFFPPLGRARGNLRTLQVPQRVPVKQNRH